MVALLASISNFVVSLNIILIKYMSSLTNPLIETTVADEPEQWRACNAGSRDF